MDEVNLGLPMQGVMVIDWFLVNRIFQPIADMVMNRWQKSCYWLAGQMSLAAASMAIVQEAARFTVGKATAFSIMGAALWFLFLVFAIYRSARAADAAGKLTAVPWSTTGMRVMWIVFWCIDIGMLIHDQDGVGVIRLGGDSLFMACIYFAACFPRPPARRETARKHTPEFAT